jgi:hypothetical protein
MSWNDGLKSWNDGLDWLGARLYGPVEPCGDYEYLDPAHRKRCRECRQFAKWLKER